MSCAERTNDDPRAIVLATDLENVKAITQLAEEEGNERQRHFWAQVLHE